MPLELTVASDEEITLPAKIALTDLTLAEIGAITCLICFQSPVANNEHKVAERAESHEFKEAFKKLREGGVIKLKRTGERDVTLEVDLNAILPE